MMPSSQSQPGQTMPPPSPYLDYPQGEQQLPSYDEAVRNSPYLSHPDTAADPRSSSLQSLLPTEAPGNHRRTLLLIYIHGFMGNETSFKSFPAHVHNLVTITMAESHVVHTKVYPRYKSRTKLDLVAEEFSKWLKPHESPDTDVILLGHSMGGLLSAEVMLLPPTSQQRGNAFRHRFIGTINFDVPFLGMHPGVISSGLASLFKPSPSPDASSVYTSPSTATLESQQSFETTTTSTNASSYGASQSSSGFNRHDTLFTPPTSDPNFNPSFTNDVNIPIRKGWRSTMHFINKHSDGLRQATKQYVKSHVEFGGAMADYRGLHARYNKIRALEECDEASRKRALQSNLQVPRERFVNYYTACYGRPSTKKAEKERSISPQPRASTVQNEQVPNLTPGSSTLSIRAQSPSPRISVEEHRDNEVIPKPLIEPPEAELQTMLPEPVPDIHDDESISPLGETRNMASSTFDLETMNSFADHEIQLPNLPPLPAPPTAPPELDLSAYPDRAVQELLKKEHERQVKAYKSALEDHEAVVADRKKLEETLRKAAIKEVLKKRNDEKEKQQVQEQEAASVADKAEPPHPSSAPPEPPTIPLSRRSSSSIDLPPANRSVSPAPPPKKLRDKRFCVLPPKDATGQRDEVWVRVFMKDVDEVGAHCGLFEINEAYERLVGDVGSRIEEWLRDEASAKATKGERFRT